MKFGLSQWRVETPIAIKAIYRILGLLSVLWVSVVQPRFPNIPTQIVAEINNWIIVGNATVYTICNYFGVSTSIPNVQSNNKSII